MAELHSSKPHTVIPTTSPCLSNLSNAKFLHFSFLFIKHVGFVNGGAVLNYLGIPTKSYYQSLFSATTIGPEFQIVVFSISYFSFNSGILFPIFSCASWRSYTLLTYPQNSHHSVCHSQLSSAQFLHFCFLFIKHGVFFKSWRGASLFGYTYEILVTVLSHNYWTRASGCFIFCFLISFNRDISFSTKTQVFVRHGGAARPSVISTVRQPRLVSPAITIHGCLCFCQHRVTFVSLFAVQFFPYMFCLLTRLLSQVSRVVVLCSCS